MRAWFLEFALVHACIAMCVSVCVCVCVCVCLSVCLSLRALLTSGVILTVCDWLKKFYGFSAFQLLYMALAINKMDEHGLSNTARCECLPRRLR